MVKAKDQSEIIRVNFTMPKKLAEAVRKKSDETGIAASFIVRKALESWINEKKGGNG